MHQTTVRAKEGDLRSLKGATLSISLLYLILHYITHFTQLVGMSSDRLTVGLLVVLELETLITVTSLGLVAFFVDLPSSFQLSDIYSLSVQLRLPIYLGLGSSCDQFASQSLRSMSDAGQNSAGHGSWLVVTPVRLRGPLDTLSSLEVSRSGLVLIRISP